MRLLFLQHVRELSGQYGKIQGAGGQAVKIAGAPGPNRVRGKAFHQLPAFLGPHHELPASAHEHGGNISAPGGLAAGRDVAVQPGVQIGEDIGREHAVPGQHPGRIGAHPRVMQGAGHGGCRLFQTGEQVPLQTIGERNARVLCRGEEVRHIG